MNVSEVRPEPYLTYARWLELLKSIPPSEQKQFVIDSLRPKHNLHIFGKYFFPHIIRGNYEVEAAHLDLIRELSSAKNSGIIFPRGHAKTTWEKIDTIHDVVYRLEPVILYISNTLTDAQFHFESMKTEFENNERLIKTYGDLVPPKSDMGRKWKNVHFETVNGVNVVARGACKGRGVNIKNQRPTKIICDDIEDDEGVASPLQRQKLHNWIYNVIFNSKDKDRGRIKFIGTVISPLCEVLVFYQNFGGIFRKAIEENKSLCPQYFSIENLYAIRDGYRDDKGKWVKGIGTRSFSQEYLNTPINDGTAVVKPLWIESTYYSALKDDENMRVVIMFDPQAGEKKGADFYGLCVLGMYPKDLHRYVLEMHDGKDTQINQAALFVRTFQRYGRKVLVSGIEKIMTQVAVYQLVLEWAAGKIDLPDVKNNNRNISVIPVSPEGKDKKARLEMHQAAFERGEIHLHQTMRAFGEKLTSFPAVEHDDDIDALIYCLEWANRHEENQEKSDDNKDQKKPEHNWEAVGKPLGDIMQKKF